MFFCGRHILFGTIFRIANTKKRSAKHFRYITGIGGDMSGKIKPKKILVSFLLIVAICFAIPAQTAYADDEKVYLGGMAAGFQMRTKGATVVALSDIVIGGEIYSPSKKAGISVGDKIMTVAGREICCSADITAALTQKGETPVEVVLKRGESEIRTFVTPKKDANGILKIGIFVRDNLNGIGTITFFKKNGDFCALGHSVYGEDGKQIEITGGKAYLCSIIGFEKGKRGSAGELKGVFMDDMPIGTLVKNTSTGIYGKTGKKYDHTKNKEMEIGEASVGKASFFTCIDGVTIREFSVGIVKVDENEKNNKNLVLKVTDKELLDETNGILQGMSGSPIVQNGKIVGAVTHVFLNDPGRGFGISISKMLDSFR